MTSRTPTSCSTTTRRPRSCRCRARATWRSSSSPCRRATTWPAGASASWSATASWGTRPRASRATTTTAGVLARIKSYHDYGSFTPIQVASIVALEGPQGRVEEIRETYEKRSNGMTKALHDIGWMVEVPKASMYIWAKIPDLYAKEGSIAFAKRLIEQAKIAVAPGIGFGDYGDDHVRIALIENEHRLRQAVRGIRDMFRKDGLLRGAAGTRRKSRARRDPSETRSPRRTRHPAGAAH